LIKVKRRRQICVSCAHTYKPELCDLKRGRKTLAQEIFHYIIVGSGNTKNWISKRLATGVKISASAETDAETKVFLR
jgi:hypothetical protein